MALCYYAKQSANATGELGIRSWVNVELPGASKLQCHHTMHDIVVKWLGNTTHGIDTSSSRRIILGLFYTGTLDCISHTMDVSKSKV